MYFSCFTELSGAFNQMLDRTSSSEHQCLVWTSREKLSHFINKDEICCRFSVTALIRPAQLSSVLTSWIFSGVSVAILDWTTWYADVWSLSIYKNDTLTWFTLIYYRASQVAQWSRTHPLMRETWVQFLGREDPLEKEMATPSRTLAWEIPRTEGPGGLQSMGSQRVRHDWVTNTFKFPLSPLSERFVFLISHKWLLSFVKSFFWIYWDDHMIFIL